MPAPDSDEMLDAIAEDVLNGVKSVSTGDQTTTLEDAEKRIKAANAIKNARAASLGFGGMVRQSRFVPPGAGPH